MDSSGSDRDQLLHVVKMVTHIRVPYKPGKFLKQLSKYQFLETVPPSCKIYRLSVLSETGVFEYRAALQTQRNVRLI